MKSFLLTASIVLAAVFASSAQTSAPDQNPSFMVSQARYMNMADSVNSWHSTTLQETYKAIDYYEDKLALRASRKAWKRELRMEKARNGGNGYDNGYNTYGNGYYPSSNGTGWGNYLLSTLPFIAAMALWCH
ncbi:hypothetical protein [Paraflavitalea sp. CAU 1676]|uniref:hypothetical protein n=1 Tax=Paraflavitalea sp. CAU 1676 TaxID=3032598 RepID=UPI0023DA750C|nr:hypothetical protein [Paraflavitalea sp. CAU 1676]MDF2190956.1 hypothetical protein [Paraflavitalea sp. CAU 1676]